MTNAQTTHRKSRKKDHWDWFFSMTLGSFFKFIVWSLSAIFVSWLIELVGMFYWWGPTHSQEVLSTEITYLGSFNRNLLTGFYPRDIAANLIGRVDAFIAYCHLREIASSLANTTHHSASLFASYGVESFINTLFIFVVRLSVCLSAVTGFMLVCLVAFIDGLVERDIRRASAGIESAITYHRAKRLIVPLIMLSFGFYMTSPFSIHPTIVFLPIMALVGFTIFTTARSFKKYL
jgi:integrating conjugative element membrane protein (TIGR03747 family)